MHFHSLPPLLVLLSILFLTGCMGEREKLAEMEARQKAEFTKTLQEKTQAIQSELVTLSTKLSVAEERAAAAEKLAKESQARYEQARKDAEDAHEQVRLSQQKLANAESRIAAAQKALADEQMVNRRTASDPTPLTARFFSWNVESEGADPKLIAKQLPEFGKYDVYGLTEVLPESFEMFASALGGQYASIQTGSGRNDRMQIIYNKERFELLRKMELNQINFEGRYRSPLVAHLKDRASGAEFLVMVNHLARGKADVRTAQAKKLVEWARDQVLPIIAIGDYNYDFVFETRKGNEGFVEMMRDGIWKWIEPTELIDTNWFDNPSKPDGKDDYPGSILDFAFVAGSAKDWKLECNVIVRPNDFPDDETTSDHRPFELLVN